MVRLFIRPASSPVATTISPSEIKISLSKKKKTTESNVLSRDLVFVGQRRRIIALNAARQQQQIRTNQTTKWIQNRSFFSSKNLPVDNKQITIRNAKTARMTTMIGIPAGDGSK